MHHHKNTLLFFFLSFSSFLLSMEEAPKKMELLSLPKELTLGMISYDDIPACGTIGRVCKDFRQYFQNEILCKDPTDLQCSSRMCVYLSHEDNFNAGTKALAFYAREYKKDPENNKHALAMFNHLWRFGEDLWIFGGVTRHVAVSNVLDCNHATVEDCIDMYAGEYGKKEMGILLSQNTELARKMKEAAIKVNSCKLKAFLVKNNLLAAKMMLLSTDLSFKPTWSGHKCEQRYSKYEFGYDKRNILKCACDCGDFDIITALGNHSTLGMITTMLEDYKIDLLKKFIVKNFDLAFKNRFNIWNLACSESGSRENRLAKDRKLDNKIFETIVTLLFFDQVDTKDESGGSLLCSAVHAENALAVNYLIERNVNFNVLDPNGFTSLFSAYDKPEIVAKLLAAEADVNARNAGGRTALMAAGMFFNWNEKAVKSIYLLFDAGADVNAVDNDGCSMLHYCARYSGWSYKIDIFGLVSRLIERSADVDLMDNQGKTAYDYAQENNNEGLMKILQKHTTKK